ncbi:MAG: phosphodiester glycosidase family protein [Chlorobiota bacterium]
MRRRQEPTFQWQLVADSALSRAVRYRRYRVLGTAERSVHVLRVSLRDPSVEVKLVPAIPGQQETLTEIVQRYDTLSPFQVVAAVNGYFWSRSGMLPVGLAATDGELLQLHRYKRWSSFVVDAQGASVLDTFLLEAWVRLPSGERVELADVNRREHSQGVVLYTRFAGDTVPRRGTSVIAVPIEEQPDSVLLVSVPTDTVELPLKKLRLRYLRMPFVGGAVPCQVLSVDSGAAAMPLRGCILSLGWDFPDSLLPVPGDTVWLETRLRPRVGLRVRHIWSGTPRLVRDGRIRVEAAQEGTTSERFLYRRRARTAIGVTRQGELLLVVVEHNGHSAGATVPELAAWMRSLGAYQALNLDGGSSSGMYLAGGGSSGNRVPVASALVILQRQLRSAP